MELNELEIKLHAVQPWILCYGRFCATDISLKHLTFAGFGEHISLGLGLALPRTVVLDF